MNSLFDLGHIPKDTSTEDDNLTNEARKRTFYERLYTSSIKNIMKIKSATTDSVYVTESQEQISAFCKCTVVYNIRHLPAGKCS